MNRALLKIADATLSATFVVMLAMLVVYFARHMSTVGY